MTAYRDDKELETYFGGRAEYLSTLRRDLVTARYDLANFAPVIIADPSILAAFGQPSYDDQKSIITQRIEALKSSILANDTV